MIINDNNIGLVYFNLGKNFLDKNDHEKALQYFFIAENDYNIQGTKEYLCEYIINNKMWKKNMNLFYNVFNEYVLYKISKNEKCNERYLLFDFLSEIGKIFDQSENRLIKNSDFNLIIKYYYDIDYQFFRDFKIDFLLESILSQSTDLVSEYLTYLFSKELSDKKIIEFILKIYFLVNNKKLNNNF